MKEVEFQSIFYQPSDSVELQGKRKKIEPYLKRGYYVKENRNGYWLLVKSSSAITYVKDEDGNTQSFDLRTQILEYYGRKKLLNKLVDKFEEDAEEGNIKFYLDENDNLVIQ